MCAVFLSFTKRRVVLFVLVAMTVMAEGADSPGKYEESLEALEKRIQYLEEQDKQQKAVINHQNELLQDMKNVISELKNDLKIQGDQVKQLTNIIKSQDGKPEHTTTVNEDSHDDIREGEIRPSPGKPRVRRLPPGQYDVAFVARIEDHQGKHFPSGSPVVFDSLIENTGNGYQIHTGTFVAPVAGTYVFSPQYWYGCHILSPKFS